MDTVGGLATLQRRKLRLSDPRDFNDPFEIRPRMAHPKEEEISALLSSEKWIQEYFNEFGKAKGLNEQQSKNEYLEQLPASIKKGMLNGVVSLDGIRRELLDKFSDCSRILCCSLTNESILMWSHYAEKHSGIVLEIETNHLLSGTCLDSGTHEVLYRTSPPFLPPMPWSAEQWQKSMTEILRTKAVFWSYEEEVRITFPLFAGMNSTSVIELELEPLALKTVFLGCKTDRTFVSDIEQALGHSDFAHVELFGSRLHERDYKLDFIPITK